MPTAASAQPAALAARPAGDRPALPTSPGVNLTVSVQGQAHYGPFHIALQRGYFRDVGLNVELTTIANPNQQYAALAQGQVQVAACSTSLGCLNALHRRADLRIVADILSAGQTERTRGTGALVVRQDLWESGAIRAPADLAGRSVYLISGSGSNQHVQLARWLLRHGVEPASVDLAALGMPEQLLALRNRAIEVGFISEPLLSAGLRDGVYQVLAIAEDMTPAAQIVSMAYWTGIDTLGPLVGERFMVAWLRAVRAYIDAFEHGVDQDEIIGILASGTIIKDPAAWREIKKGGVNPDGAVNRASLQSDADLFRQLGLLSAPIDLADAFDDRYVQFAVRYLGPYQPPAAGR